MILFSVPKFGKDRTTRCVYHMHTWTERGKKAKTQGKVSVYTYKKTKKKTRPKQNDGTAVAGCVANESDATFLEKQANVLTHGNKLQLRSLNSFQRKIKNSFPPQALPFSVHPLKSCSHLKSSSHCYCQGTPTFSSEALESATVTVIKRYENRRC